MKLQTLFESDVSIDQLLSSEEMKQAEADIKADKPTMGWERLVSDRIREMGLNVPLNIAVFLKWKTAIDQEANPHKYAPVPGMAGAWADYGSDRETGGYRGD